MKTASVVYLSLVLFAAAAQADDTKSRQPAPDLNASPWSVDTVTKGDGYFGSSSTTLKRDMGDGWSVGGKMTTPYEDQRIGGSGTPTLRQYETPNRGTTFGPVLEKKF